ncbi:MAG: rhodanese-like domain-containing protein [Flavobacteriales bacterium]|jgi:phage shock protein E
MDLRTLVSTPGATIVDVRSPMEFMGGHVANSINIPLNEIPDRIDELRRFSAPLILCCASGNRSGQAAYFLQQHGLEQVYNGGGWMQVNAATSRQ